MIEYPLGCEWVAGIAWYLNKVMPFRQIVMAVIAPEMPGLIVWKEFDQRTVSMGLIIAERRPQGNLIFSHSLSVHTLPTHYELPMFDKFYQRHTLAQHVCWLFVSVDRMDSDLWCVDVMAKMVELDIDVLHPWLHFVYRSNLKCTTFVLKHFAMYLRFGCLFPQDNHARASLLWAPWLV